MSNHLNLNLHTLETQSRHSNARQDRSMLRRPFLQVPLQGFDDLVVERYVEGLDSIHLRPALAACIAKRHVYVGERLVDLRVHVVAYFPCLWIPASCVDVSAWFLVLGSDAECWLTLT